MKSFQHFLIQLFLLLTLGSQIFSQNLFKDDFNYPPQDSLEGLGGWFRSGSNTNFNVRVISPGLTYTSYAGSGIGNTTFLSNPNTGDIVVHSFTTQTSGTLYMSFMIRIDSMPSTASQGYNIGFDQAGPTTFHNTLLYARRVSSSTFNFGIRKSDTIVFTSTAYNTNSTYLAVLKYTFVAGSGNDSSKLFIFSSGVPSTEPTTATAFTTRGTDLPDQGDIFLSNDYTSSSLIGATTKIDGIRVGKTWATSVLSSVQTISDQVPGAFSLEQNYPNPFNPSTLIRYSVAEKSVVSLKIFDALGHFVTELVNQEQRPGVYETEWNAGNLSSGVYFCRIQAGRFVSTKSLMLVK